MLALALSATLLGAGISPALAQTSASQPGGEEAATTSLASTSAATESEMPDTMTDEEMEAWAAGQGTAAAKGADAARAPVGDYCTLTPGQMWKRSSGQSQPYGTVGAKPALTNCTAGVVSTKMTTQIYMHNGWIWVKVAGPFISFGHGNMVQKSPFYTCQNLNANSFQTATLAYGANAAGASHEATDSTGSYNLACG